MGRRRIRRRRMLAIFRQLASSDGDLLLTDLPPRPSPQSKCQSFNPGISLSLPGHPAPPPGCWFPGFENKLAGNRGFTCFPDNHRCYWASLTQLCNIRLCDWRNFLTHSILFTNIAQSWAYNCHQRKPAYEYNEAIKYRFNSEPIQQVWAVPSVPPGQIFLGGKLCGKKTQIWFYLANPTFWVELHGFTGSLPTILLVRDNPEGLI